MGRLTRMLARSTWSLERTDPSLLEILGGQQTAAGVRVNEKRALQLSAVLACVRCIAEDIAKLPLILYRSDGERRERAKGHPLYHLLRYQPNAVHTAMVFRAYMMETVLLHGNAYAYIDRDRAGRPIGLWPLSPSYVRPEVARLDGGRYTLLYRVMLAAGGEEVYSSDFILHLRGFGPDIARGKSVLEYARETIGIQLAAQEYSGRFFGNDTTPGLILISPRSLQDEERQSLLQQFRVRFEGASRKHRMGILEAGWDIKPLGVSLEDAQFVQLARFGVEEIARLFRLPPHKIGHLDHATYSNIEHQGIEYLTDTLEPWAVRWEQELERKLLMPDEVGTYSIEHLMDAVLRADTESRYRAYGMGIQWGFLTPNEARARENLNPMPGADITWMPVNMIPADQAGAKDEKPAARTEARSRSRGGPALRARLARSYRPIFRDAAGRIIRREVNDIRRALDKHLGERDSSTFTAWLHRYYLELPEVVERNIMPVYHSYADAVVSAAGDEIGQDGAMTPDLEALTRDIASSFAANHAAKNRNLIQKRMREALERGADLRSELDALLEELEEKWPDKVAQREPIRFAGAIARAFFFASGVSALMWVASGSDPCPLCLELSGTMVGRDGNFLRQGDTLEAEGANPLTVDSHIGHPPLHDGCECMIAPGG